MEGVVSFTLTHEKGQISEEEITKTSPSYTSQARAILRKSRTSALMGAEPEITNFTLPPKTL
jgi:hypothetical protein